MNPSRARPAATHTTPETIAIMPADRDRPLRIACRERQHDGEDHGASAESGPSTRIRLGPNRAYASSGTIVA